MKLIPLEPNGKRPTVKGWSKDDYEAPEIPEGQNVGLRTDDIVVIDCDTHEAAESWERHAGVARHAVHTPRGTHFYYRLPEGVDWHPLAGLADHIDIRTGPGSYVVFPGSHIDEAVYTWDGKPWEGDLAELGEAPKELINKLFAAKKPAATGSSEGWDVIPEGMRNVTLTAIAGAFRKQGASAQVIGNTLATVNAARCVPPLDHSELVTIVQSVMRYEPDPYESDGDIEIISEDEMGGDEERPLLLDARHMQVPPPPNWLYHPYLPAGRLVLMDGNEGIGKGMFATWAAVQMASGGFDQGAGAVLWGSTEDDPEEDILRRLHAAGYTPEHEPVFFLNGDAMDWRFPQSIRPLAETVIEHKVKLLILDPGRSFLGPPVGMSPADFSYNNEAHLRPGLEKLNLLARKLDCTVLFIHHWNKNTTAPIRVRSGGSAAFAQTVRHRVTLAYQAGEHAIAVEKSNMANREYTVQLYELPEVPEHSTARFAWGMPHEAIDLDAWERTQRNEDDMSPEQSRQFHIGTIIDAAEGELRPGEPFWNRQYMKERWGIGQPMATAILKELKDAGNIEQAPGKAAVWVGA